MSVRINIEKGFHIPLECCDECPVSKKECGTDKKHADEVTARRRKLAEYVRGFKQIPVFVYPTIHHMFDKIGLSQLVVFEDGCIRPNIEILFFGAPKRKKSVLLFIPVNTELAMLDELKKTNKITFVTDFLLGTKLHPPK